MKFTLPISPEYVAHWGLWEAVREIYQNALDERTHDPACEVAICYSDGRILISTSKGKLSTDSLVLGKTSKRDDPKQRGKFGEGYKLALLVLRRLGHYVAISTGEELWLPQIEFDDIWNSDVLNVYVKFPESSHDGVEFSIDSVSESQWEEISCNIRLDAEKKEIIFGEQEKGRIYVGGLYVTTAKSFHCGYAFRAGEIKLDRDRGMVSGFDLAWATSQIWEGTASEKVAELLEAGAPDVEYVKEHAHKSSPAVAYYGSYFPSKYGTNAIPVSSQEEIERAANAGMKWVLVPEKVKSIYRLVKSWFIPTTKSPLEQLQDFRRKHEWSMDLDMKHDLDEIIDAMSTKKKELAA
jgi:hypothetical protein